MVQPFLKWAGGKRQLLLQFKQIVPEIEKIRDTNTTYFEPFLGAGAMLFDIQPRNAVVNDINGELINVYKVIQDKELFGELIDKLEKHRKEHEKRSSDYFYEVREWDRKEEFYAQKSDVEKAGRFIFLNKTCFNGLYRVNSKGKFNVPYGKYKKPEIVNKDVLDEVHKYLINNNVDFRYMSFEKVVENAKPGDVVYFDPPYDPLNKTSSFTSYAQEGFGEKEQYLLRDVFTDLNKNGCKVLLSNSDTPFIRDIYQEFAHRIVTVKANRAINSKAEGRGKIKEVLIVGDYLDFNNIETGI
ncbi:MAG: DNA adenine methylase [Bacillota bacterium]|nr:DNA adenine methylase [Bacillota bacterium]